MRRPVLGDPAASGLVRHLGGFLIAGLTAFTIDAAILTLLTHGLGFGPLLGRVGSVSVAMIAAWQAHRRLTFGVKRPSSLREFFGYAAVAWTSVAVNYAIYAAILVARPGTEPLAALFVASLIAMFVSYFGMRFGVFGRPDFS